MIFPIIPIPTVLMGLIGKIILVLKTFKKVGMGMIGKIILVLNS
jgi:hypothetical protein